MFDYKLIFGFIGLWIGLMFFWYFITIVVSRNKTGKVKKVKDKKNKVSINNCTNNDTELILNLCKNPSLSEEDILLRSRVSKILEEKDDFIINEDGSKQRVIPLEATLFMTKQLNPIVTETGMIKVHMSSQDITDSLKRIEMLMEEEDESLTSFDKELIDHIIELARIKDRENTINSDSIGISTVNIDDTLNNTKELENNTKNVEIPVKDIIKEDIIAEPDIISFENSLDIEDNFEIEIDPDELEKQMALESDFESIESNPQDSLDDMNLLDDIEIELPGDISKDEDKDEDDNNPKMLSEIDLPEIDFIKDNNIKEEDSDNLVDILLSETEEKSINTESIEDFYIEDLELAASAGSKRIDLLSKETIEEGVNSIFDSISGVSAFFTNLAKTKPLIYSDNKAYLYAPRECIFFAFASIYGIGATSLIKAIDNLKPKFKIILLNSIANALEDYISDIPAEKRVNIVSISKKDTEFKLSGLYFDMSAFSLGLDKTLLDTFISFPYTNEYKIIEFNKELKFLPLNVSEVKIG